MSTTSHRTYAPDPAYTVVYSIDCQESHASPCGAPHSTSTSCRFNQICNYYWGRARKQWPTCFWHITSVASKIEWVSERQAYHVTLAFMCDDIPVLIFQEALIFQRDCVYLRTIQRALEVRDLHLLDTFPRHNPRCRLKAEYAKVSMYPFGVWPSFGNGGVQAFFRLGPEYLWNGIPTLGVIIRRVMHQVYHRMDTAPVLQWLMIWKRIVPHMPCDVARIIAKLVRGTPATLPFRY